MTSFKCPRSVVIREQALPVSGAGKIMKNELRKPYWQDNESKTDLKKAHSPMKR